MKTSVADGFNTTLSVTMLKKSEIDPLDTLNANIAATLEIHTTTASRITVFSGFHSFETYFISMIFIEQYKKVISNANINNFSIAFKYITP